MEPRLTVRPRGYHAGMAECDQDKAAHEGKTVAGQAAWNGQLAAECEGQADRIRGVLFGEAEADCCPPKDAARPPVQSTLYDTGHTLDRLRNKLTAIAERLGG